MRHRNHGQALLFVGVLFLSVFSSKRFVLSDDTVFEPRERELTIAAVTASGAPPEPRAPVSASPAPVPPLAVSLPQPPLPDRSVTSESARPIVPGARIPPRSGANEVPSFEAVAVLLRDLDAPLPLVVLNPYHRWPSASLVKLMTAFLALEHIGAEQRVAITEEAVAAEGASGEFGPGEVFSVFDLVKAMLITSSNDAAEGLARSYGRERFLRLMQETAAEIGMLETTFSDPSGLSILDQGTAADWDVLVTYLLRRRPEIFALGTARTETITELGSGKTRTLVNTHPLAGEPFFLGGKTGYTAEARGNLISLLRFHDRRFLAVVLGSADRSRDTRKLYDFIASR